MPATIIERLQNANFRRRYATPPKDIVWDRYAFSGTITDNTTVGDTSPADLSASGALKSRAAMDRLGVTLPAADPTIIALIERIAIVWHLGVETDLIAYSLAREACLKHVPSSDAGYTVDLGGYVSSYDSGKNGVIATGAFGAGLKRVETYELPMPIIVDLQRDTFQVSLHTLVDAAGNTPFTLVCDGALFHNRGYERSAYVENLPDDGSDLFQLLAERNRHNATRAYKRGEGVQAVTFDSIGKDGRPKFAKITG